MQKHKRILYKETEDKLFKYFNRDNIYKGLNKQFEVLDKQIAEIDKELKEGSYIYIEEESKSPGFDERIQTSGTGISYAEGQVLKLTELKLRRKRRKQIERENILEQLEDVEAIESEMDWKVEQLQGNFKELLKMIYKDNMNEVQISFKMHLSQSQVNKRKNQILEKIFMWEKWS